MRILVVLAILLSALSVPAAQLLAASGVAAEPEPLPPLADAYRETSVRMLAAGGPRRAPGVQGRTLYDQLSKGDRDVAVISWLGYDPPSGVGLASATEGRARDGAGALTGFVRDLLRSRPGLAVTLIGHSYGSMV